MNWICADVNNRIHREELKTGSHFHNAELLRTVSACACTKLMSRFNKVDQQVKAELKQPLSGLWANQLILWQPMLEQRTVVAVDRIGFWQGNASEILFCQRTFFRPAIIHIPLCATWVAPDYAKVAACSKIFMCYPRGNNNYVTGTDLLLYSALTTELNGCRPPKYT